MQDSGSMKLIKQWQKAGAHHSSLLRTRRGISQGAILFPLFCNLYLHEFDTTLTKANIPFVRFADDFLLFTDSKEKAQEAKDFAEKTLDKLGLKLHPQKTRIERSNSSMVFLGEKLPMPSR